MKNLQGERLPELIINGIKELLEEDRLERMKILHAPEGLKEPTGPFRFLQGL